MNILFDLITPQYMIGGAGEYIRIIFKELLKHKDSCLNIIAIIDSNVGKFSYSDLSPVTLSNINIKYVDIASKSLHEICETEKIDKIFIGSGQYWGKYDIENIPAKIICVIHDLCYEEIENNQLNDYLNIYSFKHYLKFKFNRYFHGLNQINLDKKLFDVLNYNDNNIIVTVSNYSKHSIVYNFDFSPNKIKVFYSPSRFFDSDKCISNSQLKKLIDSKVKYILMLSGNRKIKNVDKTINAFQKFVKTHSDLYFVTTGMSQSKFKNHIALPYLSDSDLSSSLKNCFALLFPTFFEGFGYPPIEAMKYGKPVLCSNTTSIPEICSYAGIYFSPLFESDIHYALEKVVNSDYDKLSNNAILRYKEVFHKQTLDLQKLIEIILE